MWETIKTPAYVVDEKNAKRKSGMSASCRRRDGLSYPFGTESFFQMFRVYPLIGSYLSGTTASGLYEARLGYEEMKKMKTMSLHQLTRQRI